MSITCIIVEDEPKAMSLMEEYVKKTPFLELKGRFYNAMEALDYLQQHADTDLIFLDINLPQTSGIDIAAIIHHTVHIIFTTAYSDYAVKSYEINAIDYLLKPITYSRFLQAVMKARSVIEGEQKEEHTGQNKSSVFIKSGKKMVQINWDDIHYIEASREYLSIVTTTQKILVYKRMIEFEHIQPSHFKRVHNSYIVNLDKIEKVEDNLVYVNNREIPVGKSYRDEFYASIRGRSI